MPPVPFDIERNLGGRLFCDLSEVFMARFARNRLLVSLAQDDLNELVPHLQEVELKPAMALFEPGQLIEHVYFPLTGIVSLVVVGGDGSGVAVATIGNEGVVGLGGLLARDASFTRQVVDLPGDAARIARPPFLAAVNRSRRLRARLAAHADAFTAQLIQSAACNARHDAEQRLARWLLTVTDRSGRDSLPVTQHALAEMLGVQRPTVTITARIMQTAALIDYRRGVVSITDRAGLLSLACECYRIINSAYDQALKAQEEG